MRLRKSTLGGIKIDGTPGPDVAMVNTSSILIPQAPPAPHSLMYAHLDRK